MRIAILHFHLRPGGVTRVIELAVEALESSDVEVLVIVGEPAPARCRVPARQIAIVPELAYGVKSEKAGPLRRQVEAACRAHWGALPDVWHIHNHALGKNFALPPVVLAWAEAGCAMVLQLHDFAENGRPENYRSLRENLGGLSRVLYPYTPRIAYALLNTRDGRRLSGAGLPGGWEILPNPISLLAEGEPCPAATLGAERTLVYPTRAIRRKNIGEALLWSALADPGEMVVLTAAPQRGPDVERHEAWRQFSETWELPVLFDAQTRLGRPVNDFVYGADWCLTTSVAEGFGMAFLEPWLAGCPVVGRDLPASTNDFRQAGITLDGVYSRMEFPAEWLEVQTVEAMVERIVRLSCEAYEIPFSKDHLVAALKALRQEGFIDFGRLDENLQRTILEGVRAGKFSKSQLRPPALPQPSGHLEQNRTAITAHFSTDLYGERLAALYERVTNAAREKSSCLNAQAVLEQFLCFEDFSALCS